MKDNNYFYFSDCIMNTKQVHDTANQLHYSIHDFNIMNPAFVGTVTEYRDHAIGRLKFFIDLYMEADAQLHINETVVIDNYIEFAKKLCIGYNDDDLRNLKDDYYIYIQNQIADIMHMIDDNGMIDIDDIMNFIGSHEHLNFQEKQFILDYYHATCHDYELARIIDNKASNETDYPEYRCYHDCRYTAALNDYAKEFNCETDEITIKRIWNYEELYPAHEIFMYLLEVCGNLDFILDYDELKTIEQWLKYIMATLIDLNNDLEPNCEEFMSNYQIICKLCSLLNEMQ